jgi:hypothetical protein
MRDCNVKHFTPPHDHDIRLVQFANKIGTKEVQSIRRAWYDTVHKRWTLAGGNVLVTVKCWWYLPEALESESV